VFQSSWCKVVLGQNPHQLLFTHPCLCNSHSTSLAYIFLDTRSQSFTKSSIKLSFFASQQTAVCNLTSFVVHHPSRIYSLFTSYRFLGLAKCFFSLFFFGFVSVYALGRLRKTNGSFRSVTTSPAAPAIFVIITGVLSVFTVLQY